MNPPSIKHLNPRSIYTVLGIGFALLLFLIGLIGLGSSSKLEEISKSAGDSAGDYMLRLDLALSIRESAAEVISQTRLYRARQSMKVPNPTFKSDLDEAKKRFEGKIEEGKKMWLENKEPETLSGEEVNAWREVETASRNFMEILPSVEKLKNPEDLVNVELADRTGKPSQSPAADASGEQPQPAAQQDAHERVEIVQNQFFDLRQKLDNAAVKLTSAVTQVQKVILEKFANQEQRAATEIDSTTWGTLALGLLVATLTLILARNQIIQLRQANRQEQEAKDFARSVFDSQSNDILVVNNKGELLAINQAFLNHFDLPAPPVLQDYRAALQRLPEVAAFVGRTLAQPDDSSNLRERLEVKPQDGQNGDSRIFDVYTSPLTIGGQTGGRVVAILDVTEAEKVREELRRSRTLSAVGQITATVAHELYNPIGAVNLNLELLEMQIGDDGDLKQTVERLKRGVDHLSTIVTDLRHLTRTRDLERRTTDLNRLLDEVVELASDRLERSRVCVERNYAARLPQGEYDPQQLRKVFLNLLINAVDASPQNSDVELRTRYVSGAIALAPTEINGAPAPAEINGALAPTEINGARGLLEISVIDRGMGMSSETKRRLFEAFYSTKRNGAGLGMMITREIIKKHGGNIEVDSEEGKGTTVSVYLPV